MRKRVAGSDGETDRNGWGWVVAWTALVLMVFYLNYLTPKLWDDWGAGLCSWNELFSYAYEKYFTWNSRIFGNFFDVVMGKSPDAVADALSTTAFMAMLLCIVMSATGKNAKEALRCWPLALALWFIIVLTVPTFGDCFLWHCGISYYLFPFVLTWLFLLPYRTAACATLQLEGTGTEAKLSPARTVALCLLAVPAGWSIENLGIVAVLIAFGTAFYAKGSPNRKILFIAAGIALLGWVAMYLSPGSQVRMQRILMEQEMLQQGQDPVDTSGDIISLPEKILHMLTLHLRALPLYIVTCILIIRLWKRGLWNRKEWAFFCVCVLAGGMCQGAFFGTIIAPAPRAELVTFLFIGMACLRVIWLSLRATTHPVRWRAAISTCALLPCIALPNLISMHGQIQDYMARLEAASGKGEGVVLPPWRQQTDPVFGFIYCFVNPGSKEGYWNKTVAQAMDIPWVTQDNRCCTYDVELPEAHVTALTCDTLASRTTSFRMEPLQAESGTRKLYVALPVSKKQRCTNLKALAGIFSPRTGDTATGRELQQEGHGIISFDIPADGVIDWKKSYGVRGSMPEFWFAVSGAASPESLIFRRATPRPTE